jgi:hypothetical protein
MPAVTRKPSISRALWYAAQYLDTGADANEHLSARILDADRRAEIAQRARGLRAEAAEYRALLTKLNPQSGKQGAAGKKPQGVVPARSGE